MKNIFVSLFLLGSMFSQAQYEIGGIKIPYTHTTDEGVLLVNGAGIREKYFLDLYVGALYVKVKTKEPQKIIDANETMSIKLHIVSGMITSEKMTTAVDEGFEKSTNKNIAPLADRINQFKAVFSDKINVGDIYDLVYEPKKGMLIYKNGKLASTIPGLDFKKALFGIWLCDKPADAGLKKAMLGL